jgi:Ser/Thr protein kinase RdoA (MazF antagonist)
MSSDSRMHLLCGILDRFAIYGDVEAVSPYGSGHINDTFASRWNQAGSRLRYIHQRINEQVFARPDQVMENIVRVTAHLSRKLAAAGAADRSRRALTVVGARTGEPWVRDGEGGWWRTYLFIEDAATYETAQSPARAKLLGAAVGRFQAQLADLGGPRLHETIPGFHDMEARYRAFDFALSADPLGRAAETREEIAFLLANRERGAALSRALREGAIPERICHNDTKMNNILIDEGRGEGLCVTDLDTVMPGTPLYDVGDLVRTVTTRAEEDERDLSRVSFDLGLYEALLDGYARAASPFLVRSELDLLSEAGRAITQIMALRFLTDYLSGDRYYRIARPAHNLDRCRTQIALISSMDAQRADIEATTGRIVARCASEGA